MNGRAAILLSVSIFIIGLGVFAFGVYETVRYNSELAARSLTAPSTIEEVIANQPDDNSGNTSQEIPLHTATPSIEPSPGDTSTPTSSPTPSPTVTVGPTTSPTVPASTPTPVPTASAAGNYKMTQIVTKTPSYQNNMIESKIDGVLSIRSDDTASLPLTFTITGTAYNVGPVKITVGGSGSGNAVGQYSSGSKAVSASGTYTINYVVTAAGFSQRTTKAEGNVILTANCPAPHTTCTGTLKISDKSGKTSDYSFTAKRQ